MQFKAVLHGYMGEPQWEFNFSQPSTEMAADYVERIVQTSRVVRAADTTVSLFNMDDGGQVVARFKLATPAVVRMGYDQYRSKWSTTDD